MLRDNRARTPHRRAQRGAGRTGSQLESAGEQRRITVEHAIDLKESADMHRRIYQAIRDRDPERARAEMTKHLDMARQAQASEELPLGVLPSQVVGSAS